MYVEFWWIDDREMNAVECLFQYHFARHKSCKVAPGTSRVKEETCLISLLFLRISHVLHRPLYFFLRLSVNRHSYWTAGLLMKWPMCCPETPVTNYQATPLNIPEERRSLPSLLSLGSTWTTLVFRPCRARIQIFFSTQEQIHQQINGR
jgi:hypothetical protein